MGLFSAEVISGCHRGKEGYSPYKAEIVRSQFRRSIYRCLIESGSAEGGAEVGAPFCMGKRDSGVRAVIDVRNVAGTKTRFGLSERSGQFVNFV